VGSSAKNLGQKMNPGRVRPVIDQTAISCLRFSAIGRVMTDERTKTLNRSKQRKQRKRLTPEALFSLFTPVQIIRPFFHGRVKGKEM
jgi:hypothetical protein